MAVALAAAVVIAALVGGSAYALQSSPGASYRTALVARSTVLETLERSGTIEPVAQATVAFPMSGTVAAVSVAAGATVTTGQALASLNTTSLQADLTAKQATLAQAQLVVSQAVTADVTVTSDTTSLSTATTIAPKSQADPSTLQKATAVTAAQQEVDQTLQQATAAVQAATLTCSSSSTLAGDAGSGLAASVRGSASSPFGPTTAVPGSSSTAPGAAAASNATTCAAAEQSALTDQESLASAETNLAQAEAVLQGTLTTSSATVSPAASTTSASTSTAKSTSTTPRSSVGANTGSSDPTSGVTSAAQLVADQAAVDADAAQVTASQQNLAQATIVSPINGTVVSVGLSAGGTVSADSSTENIVVVGQGGWEVATTVPVANIANVKVGDQATVLPDGISQALQGQVVQIGVAGTTSGTTTTYPVTIGFNSSPSGLGNGASATVTIDMAQASQALTVPTSAVHSAGGLHYVTTLAKGTVTNIPIEIGAMGDDRTVVTSGLQLGQTVVLAVMNAPLPASNTATASRTTALSAATGLAGGGVTVVGGGFVGRGAGG